MQPPAGALPGTGPREDPGAAPAAREPGPLHPLQRTRHAGRGTRAVRLGRNRPSLSRPVRGHLHRRLRPFPPEDRRRRPEADGAAGARLDRLPPPEHAALRRGAAGQAAAESGPDLLREQRQRGERPGHPDGPAPHRQRRRHRHPQRLPRRQRADRGAHRHPHLEVRRAARRAGPPRAQPRPLPQSVLRHARADRQPLRGGRGRTHPLLHTPARSPPSSRSPSRAPAA